MFSYQDQDTEVSAVPYKPHSNTGKHSPIGIPAQPIIISVPAIIPDSHKQILLTADLRRQDDEDKENRPDGGGRGERFIERIK